MRRGLGVDHVERFVSEIAAILDCPPPREEFALSVARKVSALVGRLGVTDAGFAPAADVASAVREARARIGTRVVADQSIKHMVLAEIDRALAVVGRNPLPPPALNRD
jgi:hypothetical protein